MNLFFRKKNFEILIIYYLVLYLEYFFIFIKDFLKNLEISDLKLNIFYKIFICVMFIFFVRSWGSVGVIYFVLLYSIISIWFCI